MRIICLFLACIILLIIVDGAAKDRTEDARILLDKIENFPTNPVEYNGTIINGNFSLYSLGIHIIGNKIHFTNSSFNGIVDLRNVEFKEDVIFENITFGYPVNIAGAHFYKESEFKNCTFRRGLISNFEGNSTNFDRTAEFSNSIFEGTADFTEAQFNHNAYFDATIFRDAIFKGSTFRGNQIDFSRSIFEKSANFDLAEFWCVVDFTGSNASNLTLNDGKFHQYAYFAKCIFSYNVIFSKSKFFNGCEFRDSKFTGIVRFNQVFFHKIANFEYTRFAKDASFQGSTFTNETTAQFGDVKFFGFKTDLSQVHFFGDANFERSQFNGYVTFIDSIFYNDVYFYGCIFNNDVDFSRIKFKRDAFLEGCRVKGTLNLEKTEYNKLYIKLDNINEIKYNETSYKSLIDNFKKLGLFNDAYSCYYRFMKAYAYENLLGFKMIKILYNKIFEWIGGSEIGSLANVIGSIFLSIYYLLAWVLYGFGTKPDFTLFWSLFLIIVFGLFWYPVSQNKTKELYDEYNWAEYWDKHHKESELKTKLIALINPFLFSTTIFLSGTKFFIDPPQIPDSFDKSNAWVNRVYSLERFLGGVFSLLFIISIGSIILSM